MNRVIEEVMNEKVPEGAAVLWRLRQIDWRDCIRIGNATVRAIAAFHKSLDPDAFVDYLTVKYGGRIRAVRPSLLTAIRIGRRQQKGEGNLG